jgi:hypothetical protein
MIPRTTVLAKVNSDLQDWTGLSVLESQQSWLEFVGHHELDVRQLPAGKDVFRGYCSCTLPGSNWTEKTFKYAAIQ